MSRDKLGFNDINMDHMSRVCNGVHKELNACAKVSTDIGPYCLGRNIPRNHRIFGTKR